MIKDKMTIGMLLVLFLIGNAYAETARNSDLALALKCSPILILTKDKVAPKRRVIHPEPVGIVGAHSANNLHFYTFNLAGKVKDIESFDGWDPSLQRPSVNFSENMFAFLTRKFTYEGVPLGFQERDRGFFTVQPHFDYPGNDQESWNDTYFGDGPHAGENFPNTAYVHVYKTTHATYSDSITVIQYFYFYPYNDWWNNHEGDWPRVNKRETSPSVIGILLSFLASSVLNYPVTVYINEVTFFERMTHTGLVLGTEVDGSDPTLQESYDLVMLPEKLDLNQTNKGLTERMSWFGADVRWGDIGVESPPKSDNDAPRGPYYGWKNLKFFTESSTGPGWSPDFPKDPVVHSNIPYENYHHWAILGDETWSGTVSLLGDVVVFPSATLTIEAGTVVTFSSQSDRHQFKEGNHSLSEIFVYGTLQSQGTSSNKVVFRGPDPNDNAYDWGGIQKMTGGSVNLGAHTTINNTLPTLTDEDVPLANPTWRWSYFHAAEGAGLNGTDVAERSTTLPVRPVHLGSRLLARVSYADRHGNQSAHSDTTAAVVGPPWQPQGLTATAGDGLVRLGWQPLVRLGGSDLVRYEYWHSGQAAGVWSSVAGGASARSVVVDSLINGTGYSLAVRAVNGYGAGTADSTQATPQAADRPPKFTAGPTAPTVAENTTRVGEYAATDPDGDVITWQDVCRQQT